MNSESGKPWWTEQVLILMGSGNGISAVNQIQRNLTGGLSTDIGVVQHTDVREKGASNLVTEYCARMTRGIQPGQFNGKTWSPA